MGNDNGRKENLIWGFIPKNRYALSATCYPNVKARLWFWDYLAAIPGDKESFYKEISDSFPGKNIKILDVGGGTDSKFRDVFEKQGHSYTSLDTEKGADIVSNAEKMPIKDETYDFVLSIQLLEHVDFPQKVVDEMYRVLKKGGRIYVTAPGIWELHNCPNDNWRFMARGLRVLFRKFKKVRVQNCRGSSFCLLENINVYLSHIFDRKWARVLVLPRIFILMVTIINNLLGLFLKNRSKSDHFVINYTLFGEK